MQVVKPSLARGTRDFGPELMAKRKYIFGVIETIFRKYGFMPLETPAMENLSTLTGKYGDEGDRLIFKIINSGDYLKDVSDEDFKAAQSNQSKSFTGLISEKALRYDLTVPLARYVSMNRHALVFPFKRYQIQPVWRADRPQKGRYREFYQCDVDVIGSDSLFNEAELVSIYVEVFKALGFQDFTVRINNRKLLVPLANWLGMNANASDFILILDKIDKIGVNGVMEELVGLGADEKKLAEFFRLLENDNRIDLWSKFSSLSQDPEFQKGIQELDTLFDLLKPFGVEQYAHFDPTLARGLDYYTGTILEVVTHEVSMGSIGGGGRYDNLTGIFGVDGLTGVGVSFGAERILDVMEQLQLFPHDILRSCDVLLYLFGDAEFDYAASVLRNLRAAGCKAELYVDAGKMKKAFAYAEAKGIPYVALIGEKEKEANAVMLKNVKTGEQSPIALEILASWLINAL
jgi:histidyl-tRNA synthetase